MIRKGVQAEQWAARYLQEQGLQLLAQNYRCRVGEIDLVMQEGDTLVFVEVRLRSNPAFGGAAGSIDTRKQQRIIKTAQHYLVSLPRVPPCRFDALLLEDALGKRVQWLKNAFTA